MPKTLSQILYFSLFALLLAGVGSTATSQMSERVLSIGDRDVLIVEPVGAATAKMPLLIVLHGGLGNADFIRRTIGVDALAARSRVRLVFLDGTPIRKSTSNRRVWNAGACCGVAASTQVDDVSHIAMVIGRLAPATSRVTLAGHSNGAMMAARVACERPNLLDRVIAISGPLLMSRCAPSSGLLITHIHGANDQFVPLLGGAGGLSLSKTQFPSIATSAKILRQAGAKVEVVTLQRARHSTNSLNRAMRTETGRSLAHFLVVQALQ